ncbi:MAG: trypsin-like peptidase domain-containing protein [Pirellulaceae bacterium]|nr:trypsin-like peptidase domain-containing protein [Pirellulaceae bacterium]
MLTIRPLTAGNLFFLALVTITGSLLSGRLDAALPNDRDGARKTPTVLAVESARPAVVNIQGKKRRQTSSQEDLNGMGTGVIIDNRGYIVTNYHVVENISVLDVTLANKSTYRGQLVAFEKESDLAVIKIDLGTENLPLLKIGTSQDLMPGETVIAVGNAYGYQHTVTKGIISALSRNVQVNETQYYYNLIQTDASINPGNSGGPLLNINGEMIGLNVAVRVGAQGIGFAIPIDSVMEKVAKMLHDQNQSTLWHGITVKTTYHKNHPQVIVQAIEKNSPADRAGLKSGDLIQAVAKQPIESCVDFERAFLGKRAGDELALAIQQSSGRQTTYNMVLAQPAVAKISLEDEVWQRLGIRCAAIPSQQVKQLNSQYRGGLHVVRVRSGSPAAAQGIQVGDILVGLHVWETLNLQNIKYVMRHDSLADIQPLKFYILRGSSTLYGHLKLANATVVTNR